MFCKNCGGQIDEGASFCKHCGAAIEAEPQKVEPEVIPAQTTSNNQNTQNAQAAQSDWTAKDGRYGNYDKLTIALVCFFIGGLGIHCFMLGENKKGIVRIIASLCCGLGAIIALIDFIRVLTDSYTVDPEGWF